METRPEGPNTPMEKVSKKQAKEFAPLAALRDAMLNHARRRKA
jgi:hypothetical protein